MIHEMLQMYDGLWTANILLYMHGYGHIIFL